MLPLSMLASVLFFVSSATAGPTGNADLEAKVKAIFDEQCTMCHDGSDPSDPGSFDVSSPAALVGSKSLVNGKILIKAGDPKGSYLIDKLYGSEGIDGELMPQGMDPLPPEQLKTVEDWVASLPAEAGAGGAATTTGDATAEPAAGDEGDGGRRAPPGKKAKPFRGSEQIVLPTTTTLGKRNLQFRIDHRFGRIGTERGAFGLDAGVVMSIGLQYGILDGWDIRLRRTNSRKGWELGTKYVPIRQEEGMPVSFGGYVSVDYFRDFDVANPWTGNFMLMVSRLWFERWSTMLTTSYHMRTDHNPRPAVDFEDDTEGPVPVKDTRGTFDVGVATSVWLGKRKQWGLDLEWLIPIPDGASPNAFYYRGGDADPTGSKIGAWSFGFHYFTGKHLFQVFLTNNREIHPNLAAPGGQSGNPFKTEGVDEKNPFLEFNFFLGFNLTRMWSF